MDTLFSVFLGLLFLFSTVGNVSGQIPTGKDEQRGRETVWAVFCVLKGKFGRVFGFLHPCERLNSRQVCLGAGEKFASVLKMYSRACFIAFSSCSDILGCERCRFRGVKVIFVTVRNVSYVARKSCVIVGSCLKSACSPSRSLLLAQIANTDLMMGL